MRPSKLSKKKTPIIRKRDADEFKLVDTQADAKAYYVRQRALMGQRNVSEYFRERLSELNMN